MALKYQEARYEVPRLLLICLLLNYLALVCLQDSKLHIEFKAVEAAKGSFQPVVGS